MHIDWGQIGTHIIGFLIAVWLLKRYAWSAILGFVEKRRETIANEFETIEKEKADVVAQKAHLDAELEKIEETRRAKIAEAAHDAEELAATIKEDARREAVEAREKAKQDIAIELDKANEVLKDRMIEAVLLTAERMLGERLDRNKHNQLIDNFLAKAKVNP